MKKLIVMVVLFLSINGLTHAQVSIRGGINVASMSANATEKNYNDYENQSIIGYQVGLAFPLAISEHVSIQPEVVYIQKGGKSQYIANENNKLISTFTSNNIEVPISLKLGLGNNTGKGLGFYILAGPYVGIALNGKYKNDLTILGATSSSTKTVDYTDDSTPEKRIDWGANIGAGISLGRMYLDARYNLGINNLLDSDTSNSNDNEPYRRNRGIGLTLGIHF
ncbi:MAG: PorT family protein [Saprospiraceae bacterium]|nr:PorT family protein [Saprospiraceae bacterium]